MFRVSPSRTRAFLFVLLYAGQTGVTLIYQLLNRNFATTCGGRKTVELAETAGTEPDHKKSVCIILLIMVRVTRPGH